MHVPELQSLVNKFRQLQLEALARNVLEDRREQLAELNRQMLEEGKDGTGNSISPDYYDINYAAEKQQMNSKPPAGTPDLKYTGDFHRNIEVLLEADGLVFKSDDPKSIMLQGKYGPDILSLDPIRQEKVINEILYPDIFSHLLTYFNITA